jgi:predicted glycosyltransferase
MIWIDITTPKYALFFSNFIPMLKEKTDAKILVTARYSKDYQEPKRILDMHNIEHIILGGYGGSTLSGKFKSRMYRQSEMIELFDDVGYPTILISGGSVDGIQTAYGLGIKSIFFSDTPLIGDKFDYDRLTHVTRLTVPLSSLIFHPFVVPSDVYYKVGASPDSVISHDFIDICMWMDKIEKKESNDFRKRVGLDTSKHTILVREEEFNAHYVKDKIPIIYKAISELQNSVDANIVILPRYGDTHLKEIFGNSVTILDFKLKPEELYPFIDILIGGGGTMNIEASYYGIPVISTRSLWLYHDKYMIDNNLMRWTNSTDDVVKWTKELLGKKFNNKKMFCKSGCGFDKIATKIIDFLEIQRESK